MTGLTWLDLSISFPTLEYPFLRTGMQVQSKLCTRVAYAGLGFALSMPTRRTNGYETKLFVAFLCERVQNTSLTAQDWHVWSLMVHVGAWRAALSNWLQAICAEGWPCC